VDWFNRSATEIVARLAEAAQENVVRGTTEIELVQPIRDLLALGADFEHDILPAIAERVPKLTTPLRSWGARWLRDEITARKAARLNRHGKVPEPRKPEAWDLRLALFKSHSAWRSEWGPLPGSIGCRAPPELLAEYGLLPSTDQQQRTGVGGARERPGNDPRAASGRGPTWPWPARLLG